MPTQIKIAITTDSNGYLLQEDAPNGVFILPMPFLINGESYFENINLTQEKFYELLDEDATVSTSQPSIGDLADLWDNVLKEYDEIVHIPMSSGLSNSYATANTLANDYNGKVHVADNHRISVSMKLSIYDAVALREKGCTAIEIKEYLEKTAHDGSIYIAVDTMKYLKKGGRVTPAAAMIGTILKIKPVLQIHGEKLDKYALARNTVKAKEIIKDAIKKDLETVYTDYYKNGEMVLCIAHSNNKAQAEQIIEEFKAILPDLPILFCDPLPLSVSCHTGPGALGIALTRAIR